MEHLVYNAVKCLKCGEILESLFGYDYKRCKCENHTMVDGGLEWGRYGGVDLKKVKLLHVYLWEDFEKVREYAYRLHKDEKNPLPIRLKNMDPYWLEAAIDWEITHRGNKFNKNLILMIREKQYRNEKEITTAEITTEKKTIRRLPR